MQLLVRIQVAVERALRERVRYGHWEDRIDARDLEVCVDDGTYHAQRGDYMVTVEWRRKKVFEFVVRGNFDMANEEEFILRTGKLVEQHCDLSAVRAHTKMEYHFPGRIKSVTARRDEAKCCTYFTITFKNGHNFEVLDSELESEFNIAKGIMVYDLPAL